MIHSSGYLYCDLKLENILINLDEHFPNQSNLINHPLKNLFDGIHLNLIDFGLAFRFRDEANGEHIKKCMNENF